jgi:hypothetical protein
VNAEARYLQIPRLYRSWFGGMRWSDENDAIVDAADDTLALGTEIAIFIEGLAAEYPPFSFAYALHLLHLLRGPRAAPSWAHDLRRAFARAGKPLRNAGAFFGAVLPLPPVAEPIQTGALLRRIASGNLPFDVGAEAEEPALDPAAFEELVAKTIEPYEDTLEYWFRHGAPPAADRGERIVRVLAPVLPPSLAGLLASVTRRPRLAGAIPLVSTLVSGLALPRRQLARAELPLGGYTDVTTRGGFEQLLPIQLVLDELELVRRFASNELLYYRREEPHHQSKEELAVLVDQGVRTWGEPRLVLAAAALALGKLAVKRKIGFLVAGTGDGRLLDPIVAGEAAFATLLEASDLTANPALALERVLEERVLVARDVLLLTHRRSLAESDVLAAARRAVPPVRLFAVTVEETGEVALDELRRGVPVSLARFKVAAEKPAPRRRADDPKREQLREPFDPWRGDLEPIPFPFRFGVSGKRAGTVLDFDASGEWVLVASWRGYLHLARTDGSRLELLPRGVVAAAGNAPLERVDAVMGLMSGFVVVGVVNKRLTVVHYNLATRHARVHVLSPLPFLAETQRVWFSFPRLESVACRVGDAAFAVDLAEPGSAREHVACAEARLLGLPPPRLSVERDEAIVTGKGRTIALDRVTGTVTVRGADPPWEPFTPFADGAPALGGQSIEVARLEGRVLVASFYTPKVPGARLRVFRGPEATPLAEHDQTAPGRPFAVSREGKLLAFQAAKNDRVEVHAIDEAELRFAFPVGRYHGNVHAEAAPGALVIEVGGFRHVVQWLGESELLTTCNHVAPGAAHPTNVRLGPEPPALRADPSRFPKWCAGSERVHGVLVDIFGQVSLLDPGGNLVAMFFAFRGELAGWLPDGTRFGPTSISAGPASPDAARRFAAVLEGGPWG